MLGGRLNHRTGIEACIHERLAQEDSYRRFVIALDSRQDSELHVCELTAQERHHATKHLRITFALQTHEFDVTEILCAVNQFVPIVHNLLRHELFDLLLQSCVLVDGLTNSRSQVLRVVEQAAEAVEHILRHVIEFVRFSRCDRFNTTHTSSNTGLHDDANRTDTTGRRHMATTTEFDRRTILDDTHVVAVFLAEERHRTHRFSLSNRRMTALLEMQVLTDDLIRQLLHFAQFLRRHFLEVREVKTQAVRRDE